MPNYHEGQCDSVVDATRDEPCTVLEYDYYGMKTYSNEIIFYSDQHNCRRVDGDVAHQGCDR